MNLKSFLKPLIFLPFAVQISCGGGGGGGSSSFSDILPVDSGTTACTISSKSPSSATTKMPSTGTTATNFSVTTSGNDCAIVYKLNGVVVSTTGSIAAILPTQLQTGTNTLIVTATNSGGSASHTWTINRNNPPSCSAQTPNASGNSINVGIPITLTGFSVDTDNDPLTFSWTSNGGTANSTYFSITSAANSSQAVFTPNSGFAGANTIAAVINDGYDSVSCSWTVTVNSNCAVSSSTPGVSTTKVSGIGGTSTAFGVVPNDSACAVTWALNTVNVGTGPFLNVLSSALNTGANTLVATVSNGSTSATRSWTVTKNSIPSCLSQSPTATGISIPVTTARTVSGIINDGDADTLSYAWKFNGASSSTFTSITSLSDRSSATFTPGLGQVGNNQAVRLEVSDGIDSGACAWTFDIADPNTLNITSCTPSTSSTSVVKSVGPNVDYTVIATGSSLTYVWKKDGVVISGQTSPTLTVTPGSVTVGNYTYRVDVTDVYANTANCQWTVKRNAPPVLSNITPDNSRTGVADHKMNYASTLALAISGTDANSDALTYEWSLSPTPNTTILPAVSIASNTFSPTNAVLGAHSINVRAYDGNEYSDTASWDVEVNGFTSSCNSILTGKPTAGSTGSVAVTGGKICTLVGSSSVGDGTYPDAGDALKIKMQPTGVLDDGAGNLFISDELNHSIWFWNRSGSSITRLGKTIAAGQIVVLLGNGLPGRNPDGTLNNQNPSAKPSSQFKLSTPRGGMAWDSTNHRLWVTDYSNSRIVELNSAGNPTTVFGSDPGPPIVTPANNTAGNTDGSLGKYHYCANPVGLWFDSSNEWLYVACYASNAIKKMDTTPGGDYTKGYTVVGRLNGTNYASTGCVLASTNCTTTAGSEDGSSGFNGSARTFGPWEITGDSFGNIYWVEYESRLLRALNVTGSTINYFAGSSFYTSATVTVSDLSNTGAITAASVALQISNGTGGAVDRVRIYGANSFVSGACYPYTLHIFDSSDRGLTMGSDRTINLATTSGSFHSEATCSTAAITSAVISTATFHSTVYFKTTATATLTVSSAGLSNGTGTVTIGAPGAINKLTLTGPPRMLTGQCMAFMVQAQDSSNRRVTTAVNRTLSLSDGSGPGSFYSDSSCTAPISTLTMSSGSSEVIFYYKSTVAAPPNGVVTLAGNQAGVNGNTNGPIGAITIRRPRGVELFKDSGNNILGFFVSTFDGQSVMLLNNTSGTLNVGAISVPIGESRNFAGTGTGSFSFDNALANTSNVFQTHGLRQSADKSQLFIADHQNFRLRTVNLTTGIIDTALNQGRQRAGFVGSASYAPDVFLNQPSYLLYESSSKKMFYSDSNNGRILSLDTVRGVVSTEIGNGVGNGNIEDQPPQNISLRSPRAFTLLNNHLVYADRQLDAGTSRSCQIRAWNRGASTSTFFNVNVLSDTVATIAGNYGLGCNSWATAPANSNGSIATGSKFFYPEGLGTDGTNILFSVTSDHCIVKLKPDGTYQEFVGLCGTAGTSDGTTSAGTAKLSNPTMIVMDPVYAADGNFFIVDQTIAATGLIRYVNFRTNAAYAGDGSVNIAGVPVAAASTGFGQVQTIVSTAGTPRFNGLALKDDQICYSSGDPTNGNSGFQNIVCIKRSDGLQTLRIGPNESVVTHRGGASLGNEQEGISTSSAPDSNHVRLAAPYGLTFDSEGNLYFAERLSHSIRVVRKWW